jgi:CspA family cold shock protein
MKGYAFMKTGTVKWFNNAKWYGFIKQESGEDRFVHFKSTIGDGYKSLKQRETVQFEVEQAAKGLQAITSLRCDISVFRLPQQSALHKKENAEISSARRDTLLTAMC